jgi:hypothetical protein
MKTKFALIAATLMIFIIPLSARVPKDYNLDDKAQTAMLGEPTFTKTSDGLNFKVWIIPQKDSVKLAERTMDEIESSDVLNKDTSVTKRMGIGSMGGADALEATHHIMLEISDAVDNKKLENAQPELVVVTPSHQSTTVELESMMDHFGGNLSLKEKGQYELSTIVTVDGTAKTVKFPFVLK